MKRPTLSSCICQCKDTNFKANHNQKQQRSRPVNVVFANAKILILKLITTEVRNLDADTELYLPMQRY